jgi:hypothetical protein
VTAPYLRFASSNDENYQDAPIVSASGGDGGSGMEGRLAKVEASVENIQTALGDIKTDVRELRSEISNVRDKIDANFIITWAGVIGVALGLAFLMAKGFHWL